MYNFVIPPRPLVTYTPVQSRERKVCLDSSHCMSSLVGPAFLRQPRPLRPPTYHMCTFTSQQVTTEISAFETDSIRPTCYASPSVERRGTNAAGGLNSGGSVFAIAGSLPSFFAASFAISWSPESKCFWSGPSCAQHGLLDIIRAHSNK